MNESRKQKAVFVYSMCFGILVCVSVIAGNIAWRIASGTGLIIMYLAMLKKLS